MSKEIFKLYKIKPFNTNIVLYFTKDPSNLASKINKNKKINKFLRKLEVYELEIGKNDYGSVYYNDDKRPVLVFIRLNKYKKDTLIHELTHLVDHLSIYFAFQNEMEFKAYLSGMLYEDFNNLMK